MLSVIIITHNESDWIENCIRSIVPIADEIVVVDDGSTDDTLSICKKLGAKIFHHPWEGFSNQKNFAITKTTGDWIFFIDADERLSNEAVAEIKTIISKKEIKVCAIPRQNIFLGQKMYHGGWWPDYVTRLALKDDIIGWEGDLHESLKTKTESRRLKNPLYHLSHRGITWMLTSSIAYTPIEAKLRFEAHHPKIVWWRLFRVMFTEFWFRFFIKSGWQDGTVGVIEAISQSYNMFLVYVHLWEMQQGKSMEEIYRDLDTTLVKNKFYL